MPRRRIGAETEAFPQGGVFAPRRYLALDARSSFSLIFGHVKQRVELAADESKKDKL